VAQISAGRHRFSAGAPAASTANSGRYAAIAKSSSTRIDSTAGVSRLPSLRRSDSSRAITPEDEMYVTPARAGMPTPLRPSSQPARVSSSNTTPMDAPVLTNCVRTGSV
jgi:hypothetical protein